MVIITKLARISMQKFSQVKNAFFSKAASIQFSIGRVPVVATSQLQMGVRPSRYQVLQMYNVLVNTNCIFHNDVDLCQDVNLNH